MDNARAAALFALERVRRGGAWSSSLGDTMKTKYSLDARSLALAQNIALGVLQNETYLDYYIDLYARKASGIEPKVRDILRCGAYQILFADRIPDSAAVNEAVEQCKGLGFKRASGFVNAVLRRISAEKEHLPAINAADQAELLATKYSHPKWLVETFAERFGYDAAEGILKADNEPPELCIQVNTLKISTPELKSLLGERAKMHPWLPDCLITSGAVSSLPGFDDGLFYVQDPAAKCAVLCADLTPGMSVLDACAAPGGKSFAAAIAMQDLGHIDSCDIHENKIKLIKSGAERLGIKSINAFTADAKEPTARQYDCVIADVPCSGFGVIRKKPEIRKKAAESVAGLPDIQSEIINNLASSVKPGGELIYSTCTLLYDENEDVVNSFLSGRDDFAAEGFTLPNGRSCPDGYATLRPDIDGTDGFFICKLRKTK